MFLIFALHHINPFSHTTLSLALSPLSNYFQQFYSTLTSILNLRTNPTCEDYSGRGSNTQEELCLVLTIVSIWRISGNSEPPNKLITNPISQ